MFRNLNGMRTMSQLPRCLFVVDPRKEKNAVQEAKKLGITTIALIDTDCDPDTVDLPIPGNDDGIRSIEIIVSLLADAVLIGRSDAPATKEEMPSAPAASSSGSSNGVDEEMRAKAYAE
jgi:small subunit ribosomal protein S2